MTSTAFDDQFAKEPDPPKTVVVCARTHTSDQVLTGNYLQIDAEKLEKDCRLARERGKMVCVWDYPRGMNTTPGCTGKILHVDSGEDFVFCPFCGKPIKVKT
jgi:hypothetical protein